jgi:hypothetical protein
MDGGLWIVDWWIGGKGVEVEVVRGDEGALLGSGAAATRWFDGKAVAVSESFLPSCFPSSYEGGGRGRMCGTGYVSTGQGLC